MAMVGFHTHARKGEHDESAQAANFSREDKEKMVNDNVLHSAHALPSLCAAAAAS
jgi:hypothetical protein